jgi:hypothetical protein
LIGTTKNILDRRPPTPQAHDDQMLDNTPLLLLIRIFEQTRDTLDLVYADSVSEQSEERYGIQPLPRWLDLEGRRCSCICSPVHDHVYQKSTEGGFWGSGLGGSDFSGTPRMPVGFGYVSKSCSSSVSRPQMRAQSCSISERPRLHDRQANLGCKTIDDSKEPAWRSAPGCVSRLNGTCISVFRTHTRPQRASQYSPRDER